MAEFMKEIMAQKLFCFINLAIFFHKFYIKSMKNMAKFMTKFMAEFMKNLSLKNVFHG